MSNDNRNTLAWHETSEGHELVASQTIGLMKLKMGIKNISDPQLKYTKNPFRSWNLISGN